MDARQVPRRISCGARVLRVVQALHQPAPDGDIPIAERPLGTLRSGETQVREGRA
eukprot:CAMPEP_0181373168 /NCGR_PEP_ID=MMETSP1106-20121128/15216_1 /TAXON_ID=81844 /ORGANISM="Mantoniella antarctica, Strain SL-175" /LENGTH=54 /DNA_ID=CAMNT_0023490811 /DNA_START=415 /DNA_END=576 /DNA_ORIENTATION=-